MRSIGEKRKKVREGPASRSSPVGGESQPALAGRRLALVGRFAPACVIVLFLLTGFWYSLAVPPFEAPDEVYHYAFVRHLAQGGSLPVQTLGASEPWEHEGTQAPLYYFLAGRLTAGIEQDDFNELALHNPYANIGDPLFAGNKNFMLYSAQPRLLTGANLALHVARWLSLALAGLTMWLVYCIARLAFPGAPYLVLAALLFVASIPQLAFNAATCSNDSLIIAASTAVVYWLARLLAREREHEMRTYEWVVLGVLLGLAALSKLQGLGLAGIVAPVILWIAWRRRSWRLLLRAGALVLLPAAAIAGWWYWRNYTLYGEWLGIERLLTINGLRTEPRTWQGFVGEMRGLRYSFWGLFGWFNILLPGWIYNLLDALSVAALAGLGLKVVTALRRWVGHAATGVTLRLSAVHALLGAWAALVLGLLLYWSTFGTSSQGRLLFPAISAFGVLIVAGLYAWVERWPRAQRLVFTALPLGLCLCSVYTLTVLLPQSYGAPQPVQAVPQNASPVGATYEGQLEVVAVETPPGRFALGDYVPITLYLRARAAVETDVPLFVQLLDEKQQVMGNVTTHAGWGRNPTSLWQPGALYADHYLVRIVKEVGPRSPVLARVHGFHGCHNAAASGRADGGWHESRRLCRYSGG